MKVTEGRFHRLGTLAGSAALVALLWSASPAVGQEQATFTARGSVEQVHVTGATPGQRLKLIDRGGDVVDSRVVGSLGGAVFRHVEPGGGYRVRGPGGSERAVPGPQRPLGATRRLDLRPGPAGGRLRIPDHAGRDRAGDQRPAPWSRERRSLSDGGRVLGLRVREPGRRRELDRADRRPARVRRGRRQYAGHRLLWRGLRLLRAASGARRLRRDRDRRPPALGREAEGGDDGRLLRRHQPAVRRPDQAALAGGDHPAVGDRQHPDDPLSGRDPQHRIRARVGRGPGPRRRAGVADRRTGVGVRAHPGGRRDLQEEPGASPRGRGPDGEDPPQRLLPAPGRGPAVADHVRRRDRRPGVPRLPMAGRADRRPLSCARVALHRHGPEVVHVHERRASGFARPGDLQPLVRLPRALRSRAKTRASRGPQGARAGAVPDGARRLRRSAARRPDPAAARLRLGAGGVRGAAGGPGAVRKRRRHRDARVAAARVRDVVWALACAEDQGRLLVSRHRRQASEQAQPRGRRGRVHLESVGAAADRLHRQHRDRRAVERDSGIRLDPEPRRHRGVLCELSRSARTRP